MHKEVERDIRIRLLESLNLGLAFSPYDLIEHLFQALSKVQ
jgi:hypothetical protein